MSEPITVVAHFSAKPEKVKEVEEILRVMVKHTRAEPGCKRYDLFAASDAPGFSLVEIYKDKAAVEAHRATDHYKNYRATIGDLLSEPIKVNVLRALDVADSN